MKKIVFLTLVLLASSAVGVFAMNRAYQKTALTISPITRVEITDKGIDPSVVFVKLGEQVQFDTKDGLTHNLSQGEGNENGHAHDHDVEGKDSGVFGVGDAYRVQFKQVGTFNFHDHLHPNIVGTVVVYDPKNK